MKIYNYNDNSFLNITQYCNISYKTNIVLNAF